MNGEVISRETQKNENLLFLADELIQQTHYSYLDRLPQCKIPEEIKRIDAGSITCLFQVTELVNQREQGNMEAFSTVLNALHACGAAALMLLECREGRAGLYIGAVNKARCQNPYYLNTVREILSTGLQGNLPGTEMRELVTRREIENKLSECIADGFDAQCITSVSCTAAYHTDKNENGMEKLLGAVGDKNFSMLVLADPVDNGQIQTIRQGYEELSSQLSELETVSVSCNTGRNTTVSANISDTVTKSLSEGISHTQSHNQSNGWSRGESTPSGSKNENLGKQLISAGGAIAMTALTGQPLVGYATMNIASSFLKGGTENAGENQSTSEGESEGITLTEQNGISRQKGSGFSEGSSEGMSVQVTKRNRHIQSLLSKIDVYLKWLNRCENYGMFNCCTYIISGSASTNLLIASQYQALLQGDGEVNQPINFNTWTKENNIENVRESLMHLMHPTVSRDNTEFSPAMLISSRELARQMILPQESVVGVSVMEYASFGREIVRKSPMNTGKVARIGVISHMGKAMEGQPVLLDMQSLASHTFIAGTNGSGKSNTIFCLLEELLQAKIPFMVIEPAKGEYKNIFGKENNVKVFGTNRTKTPLLRMNPFWFNEDINVKEHIARLMDVFNASWPMYAAMPSVLNAAIENAYRACGWNLDTSRCIGTRIFPTVSDVQQALGEKMENTAFSDEVRGNYIGALSTRLESLSSGIYADIFSGADLGDELLFESNVLIDLSRAGSPEISAMIMGMLLIRLREYRMSEGAMNHPLRHVTVLEEAHHLLKKTSAGQSEDGANMMGKAVEMLANAIAEMRSYGDGFVIADQSPGLLDMSVLRNTNTKIIMRLPEGGDREIIGNTVGLTSRQVFELSRLKTGIAAVYQKDWLEAVLCQVNPAKHQEELYQYQMKKDEEEIRRQALIEAVLEPGSKEKTENLIIESAVSGRVKRLLLRTLAGKSLSWKKKAELLTEITELALECPQDSDEKAYEKWMADVCEVNELENNRQSRMLIAAHAKKKAERDRKWEKVSEWLYIENSGRDRRAVRGKALSAVLFGETEASVGGEETWRRQLQEGGRADRMLAEVFSEYLTDRKHRKRGELVPFAELAWEYTGGSQSWQEAYPLVKKKNYEEWDKRMRKALSRNVLCDAKVQSEILSLALQYKGADREVRAFYYPWFSRKRGMEENAFEENSER